MSFELSMTEREILVAALRNYERKELPALAHFGRWQPASLAAARGKCRDLITKLGG